MKENKMNDKEIIKFLILNYPTFDLEFPQGDAQREVITGGEDLSLIFPILLDRFSKTSDDLANIRTELDLKELLRKRAQISTLYTYCNIIYNSDKGKGNPETHEKMIQLFQFLKIEEFEPLKNYVKHITTVLDVIDKYLSNNEVVNAEDLKKQIDLLFRGGKDGKRSDT